MSVPSLAFACPACRGPLEEAAPGRLRCAACALDFRRRDGIWRFLTARDAAGSDRFLADYRRLRRDEGWGADNPAYYRALPLRDVTGRHADVWRIRAASYELLRRRLLAGGRRRRIADLGAGNGWLSWRLAAAGHAVAAVDLSDDPRDGLGAAEAYSAGTDFLRLQASFDRVPLGDGGLDLAIWNGAFHYSGDPRRTLAEARRLLRPGGRAVIMDSPVYRLKASGERMVRQRQRAWRERYGDDFRGFPAEGFLTRRRLRELGAEAGWRFEVHPLPLGWRWRLGPLAALALGRREPARFPLIVGRLDAGGRQPR